MRTKMIINLKNLKNNFMLLRNHVLPHTKICISVKANAYGHGLERIAKCLRDQKISYWGVATFSEAYILMKHQHCASKFPKPPLSSQGIHTESNNTDILFPKILAYSMFTRDELKEALRLPCKIEFMVGDFSYLKEIEEVVTLLNTLNNDTPYQADVHLKIDTGMGRLGVFSKDWHAFVSYALQSPYIRVLGICSHYSDSSDNKKITRQRVLFDDAITQSNDIINKTQKLENKSSIFYHIANSGALLWDKKSHYDMVRPGIALYGASPEPTRQLAPEIGLQPTITLLGSVASLRKVPANHSISYGATFTPSQDTNIAVINMGYGDGLLRSLSNKGKVAINGKTYPVVGRVCMDMCMVDLGSDNKLDKQITRESPVEFLGAQILADSQAINANTISYELFCSITTRVERKYIE